MAELMEDGLIHEVIGAAKGHGYGGARTVNTCIFSSRSAG